MVGSYPYLYKGTLTIMLQWLSLFPPFTLPSMHLSMLSRHFRPHISTCIPVPFSDLKKSTAVDESLSKTSTRCSVPENTNQLQDGCFSFLFDLMLVR